MSTYTSHTTGVLHLSKITPVIKALFGSYISEAMTEPHRMVSISIRHEDVYTWATLLENLQALARDFGLTVPEQTGFVPTDQIAVFDLLAAHLNCQKKVSLEKIFKEWSSASDGALDYDGVSLPTLIEIATGLDDGHGLRGSSVEYAYWCDRPELFGFGGGFGHTGTCFEYSDSTTDLLQLSGVLESQLVAGHLDAVAITLQVQVLKLLMGVKNEETRKQVQQRLVALFTPPAQVPASTQP